MTEDNHEHDWEKELDRTADETGIDPDLDLDKLPTETGLEVEDIEIVKLAAADEPVGTEQRTKLENGVHKNSTIIWYRECPNCTYQPQHPREYYDDPPELQAACALCGTLTCNSCHTICDTCEKPLCSDHRDGFSDREITLCRFHADEKRKERQFEAEITAAEQDRKDAELKLKYRLKQAKLRLDQHMQQHQQQMKKIQTILDHLHRQNRLKLQEWQTKLQNELDRRKLILDEWETAAEIDLKRQKQELEEEKLDFERKQHGDEMALKRREQSFKEESEMYEQQLRKEKHRLNKVSTLVSVAQQLDGMDNERMNRKLAKATKKLSKSDLPEVAPDITGRR